ncbi:MAG: YceD family protein [Eubacteriales bacterium]
MPYNEMPKIDVSKIYNGDVAEIPFDFELLPQDTESMDLVFPQPVRVVGRVYEKARGRDKAESYVELAFEITGRYETHCARCAADLDREFHCERVYGLSRKLAADSDEYIEVPDGLLDIAELARSVFYLELPVKVLCREDCKGLCPVCGANQNEKSCACKKNIGANTLEDLKKLLDKQ